MKKHILFVASITLVATILCTTMFFANAQTNRRELYYNDDFIYEILNDNTITIHYYIGSASYITVPSYIDSVPVVSIEALAFYDTAVKNVCISEGITTLKSEAFFYSNRLESVTLPSTLETVGYGVFRDCVKLKTVTFSENISALGSYMFYGCTRLEKVNLPDSVTNIPIGMFSYCQNLKQIDLPESLDTIYDYAFYGSGLTSVEVPKSLENIFTRAFAESKSLAEIKGGDRDFSFVSEDAFYNCIAEFPAFKVDNTTTAITTESSILLSSSVVPTETTQTTSINTDPTESSIIIFPPPVEPPEGATGGAEPQLSMGVDTVPTSDGYNVLDTTTPITSSSVITDPSESMTTTESTTATTEVPTEPQDIITDDGYFIGKSDGFLLYEGTKISSAKDTATAKREELLSLAWNVRTLGDVNNDDKVNVKDATQIQRFVALIIDENSPDFNYKNADVNTDGKITVRDATTIQKFVAKLIDSMYENHI